MIDKYPVSAMTFYDETFAPITTASSQLLRVDELSRLYIHPEEPGIPQGTCTASTTSGYIVVTEPNYSELDLISLATNDTLYIRGIHSFCTLQSQVELVAKTVSAETFILVGGVTESSPTWDYLTPIPIKYTATESTDIILRTKALRVGRSGYGTGRIFSILI